MVWFIKHYFSGGVNWVQDCTPVTYQRVQTYTEWETKTVEKPKYDCKPVNKKECHTLTQDEYDIVTVDEKGSVDVQLPTCTPEYDFFFIN